MILADNLYYDEFLAEGAALKTPDEWIEEFYRRNDSYSREYLLTICQRQVLVDIVKEAQDEALDHYSEIYRKHLANECFSKDTFATVSDFDDVDH